MTPLVMADRMMRAWGNEKAPPVPRGNAPQLGWWSVSVPGVKDYVPAVIEFCRTKEITVSTGAVKIGSGHMKSVEAMSSGLKVTYQLTRTGDLASVYDTLIAYPSEQMRRLCTTGDWVDYGLLQFRCEKGGVVPQMDVVNGAAALTWTSPLQVRLRGWFKMNLFGRVTHTNISRVTITPESGGLTASGLMRIALPELRWT